MDMISKWQFVMRTRLDEFRKWSDTNFMLLILYTLLQSIHQPTNALNKIQFMTNIKLPHVLALGCHPQAVF